MNNPAISLQGITKKFGEFVAVRNLTLTIQPGEIFGFVGPNGAGKTSTIRIITGLSYPTEGIVEIHGMRYGNNGIGIKRLLGYIPDRPYLYEKLSGREYLEFIQGVFPDKGRDDGVEYYLDLFDLNAFSDELVESYSHGMKQRLAFAAALLHDPQVLIVDEPMVGLDPRGVRLIKDTFREKASQNVAVFLSTHNLEMAEQVCHNIGIIHEGQLLVSDTIEGLRRRSSLPGSGLEEIFLRLTTEEIK